MTSELITTNAIAALNDAFRRTGPTVDWMVTASVHERGAGFVTRALRAVMMHTTFEPGNDPHGEHDFGSLTVEGVKLWFKIDYYDETLSWGSPDPSDSSLTRRMLTVMLPEDY